MKIKRIAILFSVLLLLLFSIACSFSASTANIKEAYMAHEVNGEAQATTSYTPDEVFYCLVTVANAPDDTITKAVWKAVDAEGIEANFVILESEYEGGGEMTFQASNDNLWPAGKYAVELYIDDKLKETVEFTVAEGAATGSAGAGEIGVDSAYMARFIDEEPEKVTSYADDEVFYCVVQLTGAESDTKVTAVWTAVDVEGIEKNSAIESAEMVGEDLMTFNLSNSSAWPKGSYMVEIYINDAYQGYLDFTVE
jgi:hypothetical protein